MEEKLPHLMIIWSNGLSLEKDILLDISRNFELLNVFQMHWEEELFFENLKRFYAHSQKDKTEAEYDTILNAKIEHCGNNPFTVIVFEDNSPNLKERRTSNGSNIVNVNVFDRKADYRRRLGGGHKIHASDNFFETNKDVSLLFGCDIDELKIKYPTHTEKIQLHQNVVGVPRWSGFEQLFFILNNSIEYVVLRNFENLPQNHQVETHGDVDLLVEDINYIKYLTGATSVFPDDSHRVHFTLEFENDQIPFDFRYLGDNYYDIKWQMNILKNRVIHNNCFYVPDEINHFYALLYHAYIQKRKIASDYKKRMQNLAKQVHVEFGEDTADSEVFKILNNFMLSHGYSFVLPKDFTVFFNKKFIEKHNSQSSQVKLGKLISSTVTRTIDKSFITEVFSNEHVFIKIGTNPICQNEHLFLTALKDYSYFPTCITVEYFDDTTKVEMSAIDGIEMTALNHEKKFWEIKNIAQFTAQSIDILIVLLEHRISHRDIRLTNLLIENSEGVYHPRLFDFGWSAYINDEKAVTPITLGHTSKWKGEGFSDAYSMGVCLAAKLGRLTCVKPVIDELLKVSPKDYKKPDELVSKLRMLKNKSSQIPLNISMSDRLFLIVKKYKLIERVKDLIQHFKKR